MVPLVMVKRRACHRPAGEIWTAPIFIMPRFSIRSPTLAHTTIVRIMTKVLIRSRRSCLMWRKLIVSGSGGGPRHGDHGLLGVAALAHPLPALGAQLQEIDGFVIQALALIAVPQRFAHNAPNHPRPEIIFVVEAVHAGHHFRFRQVWILNVRQLVS